MAELKNEELGNSTPEQDLSLKDQIIGESSSMNPIDGCKFMKFDLRMLTRHS